jgi:hypothetical protein
MSWHGDPSFKNEEKLSTNELPTRRVQDSPLSFLSYESLNSRKAKYFFCQRATYKGKYRKTKEAVESARAGLLPQEESVRKLRKEEKKTKEGKKVAPAKAMFHMPKTKNSFFLFTIIGGSETTHLGWVSAPVFFSTRKPCAKEVPETDYFTQQKGYLKRTTLRTNSEKAVP